MARFSRQDLDHLIETCGDPCVSIFLATHPAADEDLLDLAAVLVHKHGCRVHVLPATDVPSPMLVAALYRYGKKHRNPLQTAYENSRIQE